MATCPGRIASIEKAAALRKERDAHFLGAYPDARRLAEDVLQFGSVLTFGELP